MGTCIKCGHPVGSGGNQHRDGGCAIKGPTRKQLRTAYAAEAKANEAASKAKSASAAAAPLAVFAPAAAFVAAHPGGPRDSYSFSGGRGKKRW